MIFHTENWPIVYFESEEGGMTDDVFEQYKKLYLELLIRCKNENSQMILMIDLNKTSEIQMNYLQKMSKFNKEIYKFNQLYIKYIYIFTKQKAIKNILSMYLTMEKPAAPYKIIRSYKKFKDHLQLKCGLNADEINFDFFIRNEMRNGGIQEEEDEPETPQNTQQEISI